MPSLARRPRGRHGPRLQHVQQHDEARDQVRGPARGRSGQHASARPSRLLIEGTGTQTGNCGGATCIRWGDYSAHVARPRRLHVLVYERVLRGRRPERPDPDRLVRTSRRCTPVGAGGTLSGHGDRDGRRRPISRRDRDARAAGRRPRTAAASTRSRPPGRHLPEPDRQRSRATTPSTVTSIVVTDGNTTTQNFSLGTAPTSACLTDTTQADFQTRRADERRPHHQPRRRHPARTPPTSTSRTRPCSTSGVGITTTTWGGQTFTPAVTGQLDRGRRQPLLHRLHGHDAEPHAVASAPRAAACRPAPTSRRRRSPASTAARPCYYTATFGSPPTLTAGTQYALVDPSGGEPLAGDVRAHPQRHLHGRRRRLRGRHPGRRSDERHGLVDPADRRRAHRRRLQDLHDRPASRRPATSSRRSRTATRRPAARRSGRRSPGPPRSRPTPTLQFQVAASNSATGPFNFVGPDGTAATFFTTSGASLSQFNGKRYLEYKAYLSTTNSTVTPTLNDVTVCFNVVALPDLAITKTDGVTTAVPGGSVTYTITASNTSAARGDRRHGGGHLPGRPHLHLDLRRRGRRHLHGRRAPATSTTRSTCRRAPASPTRRPAPSPPRRPAP